MTGPVAVPVPGFAPQLPVQFTPGHIVHISPHNVFRRSSDPHRVEIAEADVHVEAAVSHGTIVVLMARVGETRYAIAYDADDEVRCVA